MQYKDQARDGSVTRTDDQVATEKREAIASAVQGAIDEGTRILGALSAIELACYEPLSADAAVRLMLPGAVKHILAACADAVNLVETIPERLTRGSASKLKAVKEPVEGVSRDVLGAISRYEPIRAVDGAPNPSRDSFCEDLEESVQDFAGRNARSSSEPGLKQTCGSLVLELQRCRQRVLDEADRRSKWGLVTEAIDAKRKTGQALRAVLKLAAHQAEVLVPEDTFAAERSESEIAVMVRGTLMGFRKDILRMSSEALALRDWELETRVRDFRLRILELQAAPAYAFLRPVDRYGIGELRSALSEWIDMSDNDYDGLRAILKLMQDFVRPLSGVNHRHLVQRADRELLREVREELAALQCDAPESFDAVFQELIHRAHALGWRSEEFAAWLAAEYGRSSRSPEHARQRCLDFTDALEILGADLGERQSGEAMAA